MSDQASTDKTAGNLRPFKSGAEWRGNAAGRPKGSRNQLGEDFLKALHEDFTAHGVQAITDAREKDPVQYVKVIASILPKELNVHMDPLDEMTDAELIDRIHQLDTAINAAIAGKGAAEGEITQAAGGEELQAIRH